MGLFTSHAVGSALGLGLLADKKTANKTQQGSTPDVAVAPGPSGANNLQPPPPPQSTPGADLAAAGAAGQVIRKRAAVGAMGTRPATPKAGLVPVKTTPKSLIGY